MTPIFYCAAAGLFALAIVCLNGTSVYSTVGGSDYERRRTRRTVGIILLIAAALLLGVAIVGQLASRV